MSNDIMPRTQISRTTEQRRLLDAETAHTGRSISTLIREAVSLVYGSQRDTVADLQAINAAFGAWGERDVSGEALVELLRSGGRLGEAATR